MTGHPGRSFDPVAVSSESTVVAEYVPEAQRALAYQSEAQLEREFIRLLEAQAYEFLPVTSEAGLIANLRVQLEQLNEIQFSDDEWKRFFWSSIAASGEGVVEKTTRIQEDHVQLLRRDDGSTKNIALVDKEHIHNNRVQVLNQYEVGAGEGGARFGNRYDVTILVNGLPMVHVELKRRGVDLREAFRQIDRYARDSFWAGSGLFEYVQLFVISNGTLTKYYSNTVRLTHLEEKAGKSRAQRSSNSFEFTSWWADASNQPIQDLIAFGKTFFAKHTLLNILTRYCIFTADRSLLVMRPYQIVATERILRRVVASTNYRRLGTVEAGGYVWHTTGSGKTLTSFKTAQLATRLPSVEKVLFVVDRKDLDYQTMREYERFEKGAANSNTSTRILKQQLEDPNAKIIITTIQKLSMFIKDNAGHKVFGGHIVIIFDECHRSQFGDMHAAIRKAFRKYHLFGFTGTPIFAANASAGGQPQLKTTEQAFGDRLHTYTIVDAITDKNVLPFRIDYVNTIRVGAVDDRQVSAIDTERALMAPQRIQQVVAYILEHFDQKTRRASHYTLGEQRIRGFNSLFATASIRAAKTYYREFQRQQADLPAAKRLQVGLIYSYAPNQELADGLLGEEEFETEGMDLDDRSFLADAIEDYNQMFGVSYDTSAARFQNYYKDLSHRIRSQEIDMVIVVNMFLTGFDATTLNTLWVDKNLRMHGLIQAFSRTNRILNSVKTYGNIVSFRNLEDETNEALALFGNKAARGIVLLKPYHEYYHEYAEQASALQRDYPAGKPIVGEGAQKDFITRFGHILRLRNILVSFDEFAGNELLTDRDTQDYQSRYLELWQVYKTTADGEKEAINDDVVFEIELIKQVEVNVDYILLLVEHYRDAYGNGEDKELRAQISRAVASSPSLRNKQDLIEDFVDNISLDEAVADQWEHYIQRRMATELETIIEQERLKREPTEAFLDDAFHNGAIPTTGTAITTILPPVSRFSPNRVHSTTKQRVLQRLHTFFDRFFGL